MIEHDHPMEALDCPFHDDTAICTECPSRPCTNGRGFPHRKDAKRLTPLIICPSCQEPKRPEEWNVNAWRCHACLDLVCPMTEKRCGHECDLKCRRQVN